LWWSKEDGSNSGVDDIFGFAGGGLLAG